MITVSIASCLKHPARVEYLKKTITSIAKYIPNAEYLIAFDNTSDEAGKKALEEIYKLGLPLGPVTGKSHTRGLGHSWNWGIQEAQHPFILQTEDDWVNHHEDLMEKILLGIEMAKQDPMTVLRLDNMKHDWYRPGCREHKLFWGDKEFTDWKGVKHMGKMMYELNRPPTGSWEGLNNFNIYFYSNHPQIKSKHFHQLVGWFGEGITVPQVEVDMCKKVLLSNSTRMFFFEENTFQHIGDVQVRQN